MTLASVRVSSDDRPRAGLVMLHGIFGRGRNWSTIARKVVDRRPEYACWLLDLPYHGDSPPALSGDTVADLAADVDRWRQQHGVTVSAVLGHSFGGKVALALADHLRRMPLQVWIVDSTPEAKSPGGSAWNMLHLIRQGPDSFASRLEAVEVLTAGGFTLAVAQWMASNLVRDSDRFRWRLDLGAMARLLDSFFATDLWPLVSNPSPGHEVHFIKASESSAMSETAARRVETASHPRVHLHRRAGSHWIHAESPDVVADLLVAHLPVV